jgi:hypothetical protein
MENIYKSDKSIYELKFHESLSFSDGEHKDINITRVPGGWIYRILDSDFNNTIFVPFSDEFMSEDTFKL